MISFGSPAWLGLLVLLPLGALAYRRTEVSRRRARAAFASPATMPSVERERPRWRRHAPYALYAVAGTVAVLALAKPETTVAVPREQASVILATDVSSSMRAEDVKPSRLEAVRRAALGFAADAPERLRVGVVTFNHSVQRIESPSADRRGVRAVLRDLQATGGTANGDAIDASLRLVDGRRGKRPPAAIVLLSDGKSTSGRDAVDAARVAADARVPVHTVALGTDSGTITRLDGRVRPAPPDREAMRAVAEASGGRALRAADAQGLREIYDEVGSQVATKDEKREVSAAFAGGAGLLLLAGAFASLAWFGRLP